jgi:hypothetical protein
MMISLKVVGRWLFELSLGILIVLLILWIVVTQPLFSNNKHISSVKSSPQNLQTHVYKLSVELAPRTFPENLDKTANYLREQWQLFGRVTHQAFQVDAETYQNLSISFGPTSSSRIVIGAHYDAYNELAGADDNASGIAGLIELARLLSQLKLTKQVDLVAFTLEEPPFFRTHEMGSAVHVQELLASGTAVELMINLEMIGYYSDAANSQDFPFSLMKYVYGNRGDFIAIVGSLSEMGIVRQSKASMRSVMNLPVHSINAPTLVPGIDFSDHSNYWQAGFPALMITDTAFYRNHAYHSAEDTWDRLDYEKMAEVVNGVAAIIVDRAGRTQ